MFIINPNFISLIDNYSSLNKIKRIIAWCMRFINNCCTKSIEQRNYSIINNKKLDASFMKLI